MPPDQCITVTADLALAPTWRLRPLSAAIAAIRAWIERSRQRRGLADLDDRLLDDIGLIREEAQAEARKPFWRA